MKVVRGLFCLAVCLFNYLLIAESPAAKRKIIKKKIAVGTAKRIKKRTTPPKTAPIAPSKIEEVPPPPPLIRETSSEEIPPAPALPSEKLIFTAAKQGFSGGTTIEVLERIINQGSGSVHDRNEQGQTPLMIAIAHNNAETVKDLLDLGSDRTALDSAGHSVPWYVQQQKNPNITKLFESTSSSAVPAAPEAPTAPTDIPSLPSQEQSSSFLEELKAKRGELKPGAPAESTTTAQGKISAEELKRTKLKPVSERELAPAKKEKTELDIIRERLTPRRQVIEDESDDDSDWED